MIPREHWKYRGMEGHLIIRHKCRFRLCTDIGRFRVSTVGAYYPYRESDYMEIIGLNRHYETYVFNLNEKGDCEDLTEIESDSVLFDKFKDNPYDTDKQAEAMHDKMCHKYAEIGFKEWMRDQ